MIRKKLLFLTINLISILILSGCSLTAINKNNDRKNQTLTLNQLSTPILISFLNKFPKGADLHNHASGAIYIEFSLEYALAHNYYFSLDQQQFVSHQEVKEKISSNRCDAISQNNDCLITAKSLISNYKALSNFLNVVSIRGSQSFIVNNQDHFFNTFKHSSIPNEFKNEALASIAARNIGQGVRYVELMTSSIPKDVFKKAKALLSEDTFNVNSFSDNYLYLEHYINGKEFQTDIVLFMDEREKQINSILEKNHNLTIMGERPDIVLRYIPQLYRTRNNYEFFIGALLNMKASKLDRRIVATNIVGNEASISSKINFDTQMKILDFFWEKFQKPNITLHAGELVLLESSLEAMRSRISNSIINGHASRIGHGVSIPWETNPQETLKMMKKNDIAIEICLSSNYNILEVNKNNHPFMMYKKAGVPITIATDDEGVFRSNLTMEYLKALQDFNLGYKDIKRFARNGLKYSYLQGDGIYKNDYEIKPEINKYLVTEFPTVSKLGMKKYLQIRLERDFISHENIWNISK